MSSFDRESTGQNELVQDSKFISIGYFIRKKRNFWAGVDNKKAFPMSNSLQLSTADLHLNVKEELDPENEEEPVVIMVDPNESLPNRTSKKT